MAESKKTYRISKLAPWQHIAPYDVLFTQIATILRPRGITVNRGLCATLRRLAIQHARPGYPARDVLQEIKTRLQQGALLSTILNQK